MPQGSCFLGQIQWSLPAGLWTASGRAVLAAEELLWPLGIQHAWQGEGRMKCRRLGPTLALTEEDAASPSVGWVRV